MSDRQPISKGKRFEVFARDGFTCMYCGRRPPEVVLEVDHIEAVANGGTNEDLNLITSCCDCNRGKAAKKLSEIRPRPDADVEYMRVQQEIAEARRYLDAKAEKDAIERELIEVLNEAWVECLTSDEIPTDKQWFDWLKWFEPAEIEASIRIATRKHNEKPWMKCWQLIKYVSGILHSRRKQEANG